MGMPCPLSKGRAAGRAAPLPIRPYQNRTAAGNTAEDATASIAQLYRNASTHSGLSRSMEEEEEESLTAVKRSQQQQQHIRKAKPPTAVAATAITPITANIALKSFTYQAPLPAEEPVRLLSDAVPSLKAVLLRRPPFQIKTSDRLSAPPAVIQNFPDIDSLFRLRAGIRGQRRRVRHEISESVSCSEASPGSEVEQEFYFENIDVRNDLIAEATAVLSSLSNAQVSADAHADTYSVAIGVFFRA